MRLCTRLIIFFCFFFFCARFGWAIDRISACLCYSIFRMVRKFRLSAFFFLRSILCVQLCMYVSSFFFFFLIFKLSCGELLNYVTDVWTPLRSNKSFNQGSESINHRDKLEVFYKHYRTYWESLFLPLSKTQTPIHNGVDRMLENVFFH